MLSDVPSDVTLSKVATGQKAGNKLLRKQAPSRRIFSPARPRYVKEYPATWAGYRGIHIYLRTGFHPRVPEWYVVGHFFLSLLRFIPQREMKTRKNHVSLKVLLRSLIRSFSLTEVP
jgi:hypothetical protein